MTKSNYEIRPRVIECSGLAPKNEPCGWRSAVLETHADHVAAFAANKCPECGGDVYSRLARRVDA